MLVRNIIRNIIRSKVVEDISLYIHKAHKLHEARKELKRVRTIRLVRKHMECPIVRTEVPFFMGGASGLYNPISGIRVARSLSGVLLVDALFHEDRHYQQDVLHLHGFHSQACYTNPSDGVRAYGMQPIEKDARRYAYVHTCRWLEERIALKGSLGLVLPLYKFFYHPWKGVETRKFR